MVFVWTLSNVCYSYSWDPNTRRSNYGTIQTTDFSLSTIWMVRYSEHHSVNVLTTSDHFFDPVFETFGVCGFSENARVQIISSWAALFKFFGMRSLKTGFTPTHFSHPARNVFSYFFLFQIINLEGVVSAPQNSIFLLNIKWQWLVYFLFPAKPPFNFCQFSIPSKTTVQFLPKPNHYVQSFN